MHVTTVRTQRTFEAISEQIRLQIRAGELRTGDRLPNERELAQSLAVSRHAVREALRALETEGLVELRKGAFGGAFISEGGPQAIADVMRGMYYGGGISLGQLTEARLWIESVAVREACRRADEGDFRELESNVALAERDTREGRLAEKTRRNIEFHNLVAKATRNPVMTVVMGALMSILREFVGQIGSVMGMDVIRSRRRLLVHMRARDAEKAVAEMEKHLKRLHKHYLQAAARLKVGDRHENSRKRK